MKIHFMFTSSWKVENNFDFILLQHFKNIKQVFICNKTYYLIMFSDAVE